MLAFALLAAEYPTYAVPRLAGITVPGLPPVTGRMQVDQFGYRPEEAKFAIITQPVRGYNAGEGLPPSTTLELRDFRGRTVHAGAPTAWNAGQVHEDSGDRGWWFDFSKVRKPGRYYVYDPGRNLRSPTFAIRGDVFAPILRTATRAFYYQRLQVPLATPYAEKPWDEPASLLQDREARYVNAKDDPTTARDLSGGWMDAGDTNKYPPFNGDTLHPLLYAYRNNPRAFGDANGIPESGNGRPDLLDEVKVQLDWLVKMQEPDGGVWVKMGNIDYSGSFPLSTDKRPRYYGPKDSGATIFTAANFAHAARVYAGFPAWRSYAAGLKERALKAWNHYKANPRTFQSDTGEIKSGIANKSAQDQDRMEAFAAVHLFALTGEDRFHAAIKEKAPLTRQLGEGLWSPYESGAGEALLDYTDLPNADPALRARIRQHLTQSARAWLARESDDLYRAWMVPTSYHWGSNFVRAAYGIIALQAVRYGDLTPEELTRLRQRAADLLHSFHGVNPLSAVMLSNMARHGAERSMMRIYHERYNFFSPFAHNPAPGFVVGGPNQSFSGKAAEGKPSVEWIKTQPRAKAFADMNNVWPESSWELSEPAIYYQSMYVRLLSAFAQ
jgi:hypothetical protein